MSLCVYDADMTRHDCREIDTGFKLTRNEGNFFRQKFQSMLELSVYLTLSCIILIMLATTKHSHIQPNKRRAINSIDTKLFTIPRPDNFYGCEVHHQCATSSLSLHKKGDNQPILIFIVGMGKQTVSRNEQILNKKELNCINAFC